MEKINSGFNILPAMCSCSVIMPTPQTYGENRERTILSTVVNTYITCDVLGTVLSHSFVLTSLHNSVCPVYVWYMYKRVGG